MRFLLLLVLLVGTPLIAQRGGDRPAPEEGIPVTDPLVVTKCGVSRISWERTTPERWEEAIKRMVRLNGLTLRPEEARAIVKSLSATHGLAPEEAKLVMYIPEQRIVDETLPNETVRLACASCHAIGRARNWRRSKEEWTLLAAMHSGYFPVADSQSFYRRQQPNAAAGPEPPQPVDLALDYLSKEYPLNTPEWAAWRARMRAPKLSGRWIFSGTQAGRGKVVGEMAIEPGASEDEFTTNVKLTYLKDGSTVTRSGGILRGVRRRR